MTKHLSSEERVASLCRLFGCRFSEGRAEGAPSIKRAGVAERLFAAEAVYAVEGRGAEQDGHKYRAMAFQGGWLPEPYLQLKGDLAALFSHAVAPEELEEVPEEVDWLEDRGTRERQAEAQKKAAQIRDHNRVDMLRCGGAQEVTKVSW